MVRYVPAHRRLTVVGPLIDRIELYRRSIRRYRHDDVPYVFSGNVLEVSTNIGCSVNCVYCPQRTIVARYQGTSEAPVMNMDPAKLQECLRTVPSEVDITFSGFSEPFLNPDAAEMMAYCHHRGHRIRAYTTLVGLDLPSYHKIRSIPFVEFVVHLPDREGTSNIPITPEYLELLGSIVDRPPAGIRFCILGRKLDPRIDSMLSAEGFTVVIIELTDRVGNLALDDAAVARPRLRDGKIACLCRLRNNMLLPDGRVYSCFNDFSLKYKLGNLAEITYQELFESPVFKMIERSHADPDVESNCRRCIFSVRVG